LGLNVDVGVDINCCLKHVASKWEGAIRSSSQTREEQDKGDCRSAIGYQGVLFKDPEGVRMLPALIAGELLNFVEYWVTKSENKTKKHYYLEKKFVRQQKKK